MLKKIYMKNYRAFDDVNIDLSKINLFFGPNNSGKSALISAINLISQTLESGDINVPLLINGKRIELGSYNDLVYQNDARHSIELGYEFEKISKRFGKINGNFLLQFHYRKLRREIILNKTYFESPNRNIQLKTRLLKDSAPKHKFEFTYKRKKIERIKGNVNMQHFIPFLTIHDLERKVTRESYKGGVVFRTLANESRILRELLLLANDLFLNIEYISPIRNYPERTFTFAGESPKFVGKRGERAIDILLMDYLKKGVKDKKNLVGLVSNWFKQSEIANAVHINILTDRHFEIQIENKKTKETENLLDVGFGCSQILPILVSGYNLSPGNLFIVEQPEVHLHPKAQAELGSFFYDLYKNQIQSIIETHSEHLLLRLQSYIAKGLLNPLDIKIYYVYGKENEKKYISEIKINDDGFFDMKQWPEGFFPERTEEIRKIAIPD